MAVSGRPDDVTSVKSIAFSTYLIKPAGLKPTYKNTITIGLSISKGDPLLIDSQQSYTGAKTFAVRQTNAARQTQHNVSAANCYSDENNVNPSTDDGTQCSCCLDFHVNELQSKCCVCVGFCNFRFTGIPAKNQVIISRDR